MESDPEGGKAVLDRFKAFQRSLREVKVPREEGLMPCRDRSKVLGSSSRGPPAFWAGTCAVVSAQTARVSSVFRASRCSMLRRRGCQRGFRPISDLRANVRA
jgi:hypothetical protein